MPKHIAINATRNYAQDFATKPPPVKKDTSMIIILESIDFSWRKPDIQTFRELWQCGVSLIEISEKLNRPTDEVALLIIHEAREGTIQPRTGGVLGSG
jgi:hypothetical protein